MGLKIVMVSAEVETLARTGGLGDAVAALAVQLAHMGHDVLVVTPHAAYLLCPQGLLESLAGEALLGKLGRGVTTRNWATVLKLRALLGKPG